MQIVILGNGFDLASGLPTSYQDFMGWRFNKIKQSNKLDLINYYIKSLERVDVIPKVEFFSKEKDLWVNYNNDKKLLCYDFYNNIKNTLHSFYNNGINYFDLYFYMHQRQKDWCDVENKIKEIVVSIKDQIKLSSKKIIDIKENMNLPTSITPSCFAYSEYEVIELLTVMFLEECMNNESLNIYEILMKELRKFENEFQKYISNISFILNDKHIYQDIYIKNFYKLINPNTDTYILNFNYTSIKDSLHIEDSHFHEINVHGKYDYITIFGIDQTFCDVNTDEFIFSKTYRKMASNIESMELPCKVNKDFMPQELIFYGHSLSAADYSYFQSLFDSYDIYNQTFLTFKYSVYDENKRHEIKKKVFDSITKLLINYGNTMTNKDHGRNLLHKILLEGRLKIEEIVLDDMKYKGEK